MSAIGPGDVVVCVDGDCGGHGPEDDSYATNATVIGRHYTVQEIVTPDEYDGGCVGGVLLCEIAPEGSDDGGFCVQSFRKIAPDPALAQITTIIRNCRPVREKEPTNG